MSQSQSFRKRASGDLPSAVDSANHRYYFDTGVGYWIGTFSFAVTDWQGFLKDTLGLVDRLLVLSMALLMRLSGDARITSFLEGFPDEKPAGVVTNTVRITKWGVTLYLLHERYLMHPDGRGVTVDSKERFGPVPFLFSVTKAHAAEVVDNGTHATYYMPLLGTDWVGEYHVAATGDRIRSTLTCDWAEATEDITRVS